jgi:dipeptidyl aminopeptidase/acylaminoacyl peptidase
VNPKFCLAAAAASVALCASLAHAAPLEAYGQLPVMSHVAISPDGGMLAYVTPKDGKQMVVVERLSPFGFVTGLNGTDQKVRDIYWGDPQHLVVIKSVTGRMMLATSSKGEWWMAQSLDIVKRQSTPLLRDYGALTGTTRIKDDGETTNVVTGDPEFRDVGGKRMAFIRGDVFVDGHGAAALYSVDLASGMAKVIEKSLSYANWDWIIDEKGAPVAEYGYDEERKHWTLRIRQASAWTTAYDVATAIETPDVEGISPDGSSLILYVLDNGQYQYKPLSLKDGTIGARLPAYDKFLRLLTDPVTHRIIGGVSYGANTEYTFFDSKDQGAWDGILQAFPGEEVDLESWSDDKSKVVVLVTGPAHGIAYILVDLKTHQATKIGDAYPSIKPDDVAAVEAIEYEAADGLKIPAYLTLPNGKDPKKLPLVVMPHGGPAAMDEPGFDWWAQALASRGYAVLQPQFRGSYGYGWSFMSAGFGQFGRKMETDLSDGVRSLAVSGIIDPKRVCIVGASYGGYAALAGATLDTGVYRCAVSDAGLSDLHKYLTYTDPLFAPMNDPNYSSGLRFWDRYMGIKGPDDPAIDQISPLKHIDRVSIPILLIHGRDDTVVPFEQSQMMADALKASGKTYDFVVMPGEDHWLSRSETRLQMLQATVKFLEANNPPG